ncbi:MAG: SDR family oxidoreductase, partial [Nioella sp.]
LFARPFDVVIANAGAGKAKKLVDVSLADWQATMDVNLTGTFLTFREGLRGMAKGGRLIAIASTAALQGGSNIAPYAASKHGVLGLVRSVAKEVAKSGITCNAICPGFVDTEMADAAARSVMDRFEVSRDKAISMITSGNPMARLIAPEEVVSAALFLASAGASAVNGHALSVSGGEV